MSQHEWKHRTVVGEAHQAMHAQTRRCAWPIANQRNWLGGMNAGQQDVLDLWHTYFRGLDERMERVTRLVMNHPIPR